MKIFRTTIALLCLMVTGYSAAAPVPAVINVLYTYKYEPGTMAWWFTVTADVVLVESPIGDRPALVGYNYGLAANSYCTPFNTPTTRFGCTFGTGPKHDMVPAEKAKSGETISQVLMRVYNKSGGKFTTANYEPTSGSNPIIGCIGAMYNNVAPAPNIYFVYPGYGTPINGQTCVVPPEPNQYCDITTANIDIDHGPIAPSASNTQRRPLTIHCTNNMTVRLSFQDKKLTLAPGITSNLSIPETAANGNVALKAGDNTLNIQSELTAINGEAGEHEASTVLFLNYL